MFSFVFSIKGYTGGTCSNHSHFFLMEFRISQPSGGLASGRTCCAWRSDRLPQSEAGFLGRRRIYDCGPLSWNLATRWQRDPDCRMWRKRPLKLETQRTCKISELDDGWPESAEGVQKRYDKICCNLKMYWSWFRWWTGGKIEMICSILSR